MNASSTIPDEMNGEERSRQPQLSTRSLPPSFVDDDDPTSSSGSSSSSESESDSDEQGEEGERDMNTGHNFTSPSTARPPSSIPHIPGRPKPRIHRLEHDSSLLSRISAFLPKMKDANENLQREIEAGRAEDLILDSMDDDDHNEEEEEGEKEDEGEGGGRQYIEMNLGLGVLEEKRGEHEDADLQPDAGISGSSSIPGPTGKVHKDSDVLGKLMGSKQSSGDKPSIEEIAD